MTSFHMLLLAATIFVKPQTLPQVPDLVFTHVADFTGDGQNDLLYVDRDAGVSVFPGTHGRWSNPISTSVRVSGRYARFDGVADFNSDGALDLHGVIDSGTQYVPERDFVVVLGDGHGRFGAASVTEVDGAHSLVADFDRDGKADVVRLSGTRLRFLRGNGDGTFATPLEKETPPGEVSGAAAGDFDGDGWVDVAAAIREELVVFWNERGGSFRFRRSDVPAVRLAAGRMNGDRTADLLITSGQYWSRQRVTRGFFGTPGARVLAPAAHAFNSNDSFHVLRDLDGNGTADVLAQRDGAISVVLSHPDGTFSAPRLYFVRAESFSAIAGDFDSNGTVDAGWLNADRYSGVPGGWLPGSGDGTLHGNRATDLCDFAPCAEPYEYQLRQEQVMDVTGDGVFDFVIYMQDVLTVVPAGPRGEHRLGVTTAVRDRWPYAFVHFAAGGDLNGDGHDDLVLVRKDLSRYPGAWETAATWTVMLGRRDGSFDEGQVLPGMPMFGRSVEIRDATGDGILDLVEVADGDVHPGDGRGHFGPPLPAGSGDDGAAAAVVEPSGASLYLRDLLLTDLTGDGYTDRVEVSEVYEDGYPQCCYSYLAGHEVTVMRRTEWGFDETGSSIRLDDELDEGLAALDFDADGHTDLLIGANVYLGAGDGTFRSGSAYRANLAAVVNGRIVARNAHTYAELATAEGPATGPEAVTLQLAPSTDWNRGEVVRATVTAAGPLTPGGTVRFELEGESRVVQLEYGMAMLDWEWADGITGIVATYSGDENFAPATVTIQRQMPMYAASVRIEARTPSGSPAGRILRGTPLHLSLAVIGYGNGPAPSGGTLTLRAEGKVLGTWAGTSGELVLDDPSFFDNDFRVRTFFADWAGNSPHHAASGQLTIRVVEPPTGRRRSVR